MRSEGSSFGEWDIIYNQQRSRSAFAINDLDLIYVDKENFNRYFSKYFIKSDQEKRIYLKNVIEPLKNLTKFDDLYKKMQYCVKFI